LYETGAIVIERGDIRIVRSVNNRERGSFRAHACASKQRKGLIFLQLGAE